MTSTGRLTSETTRIAPRGRGAGARRWGEALCEGVSDEVQTRRFAEAEAEEAKSFDNSPSPGEIANIESDLNSAEDEINAVVAMLDREPLPDDAIRESLDTAKTALKSASKRVCTL